MKKRGINWITEAAKKPGISGYAWAIGFAVVCKVAEKRKWMERIEKKIQGKK